MLDKIKKFFKALIIILKENVKKVNFWVSFVTLIIVAILVVLKLAYKVDIASSSIIALVTSVGIIISLVGQMLGNSTVVSAGENLDATKITTAADKLAETLESILDQVNSIDKKASTTTVQVNEVAKAVGVKDDPTPQQNIVTSLNSILDKDGNIVGTKAIKK